MLWNMRHERRAGLLLMASIGDAGTLHLTRREILRWIRVIMRSPHCLARLKPLCILTRKAARRAKLIVQRANTLGCHGMFTQCPIVNG
tara:strand:- start:363 stop:626 length:264 start_codon:yes stop_codon:yes gene_type:complete